MTSALVSRDQLIQIANCLAEYRRLRERYDGHDDFTKNASSSIKSSALYCANVLETAYFDLNKIEPQKKNLEKALYEFSEVFKDSFSRINSEVKALQISLEALSETLDKSTLPKPKTKPPNHKTRYIAAIVANCFRDKFQRWPITPARRPQRAFIKCTEQICVILDKRNLYGISGACEAFAEKPWHLWDNSPPSIN
jgi:hypothetical protein